MENKGIRLIMLSVVSILALLVGCSPAAPQTTAPPATTPTSTVPSITMLQPEEGVTYGLGLVTVRVSVSNFDLGPDDGKII